MPKPDTIWDCACKQKLYRTDIWGQEHLLDRGVNYFILKLETLGVRTWFSCEGHPTGFYIMLEASYPTAIAIARCGYFIVAINGDPQVATAYHFTHPFLTDSAKPAVHSLSYGYPDWWHISMHPKLAQTERQKRTTLRQAAAAWETYLVPWLQQDDNIIRQHAGQALATWDQVGTIMTALMRE